MMLSFKRHIVQPIQNMFLEDMAYIQQFTVCTTTNLNLAQGEEAYEDLVTILPSRVHPCKVL